MEAIDIVTLTIAVLGLGLAVASFTWQMLLYKLTGGRVKLEPIQGLASAAAQDMFTIEDGSLPPQSIEQLRRDGYTLDVTGLIVRNVGRLAVSVTQLRVEIARTGVIYTPMGAAFGPPLSHRIEPGESANWAVHSAVIRKAAVPSLDGRAAESFTFQIQLGNGAFHRTPPMPIPSNTYAAN